MMADVGADVSVVLPVLNEAEAIPWVLGRFPAGFLPIVVDNGSTDGSAEVARGFGARVVNEHTRGFGAACFAGLVASETDLVAFMDCDGSLDPRDLVAVTAPVRAGQAQLVLGERRPQPGAWPLHARVANRWLARAVRRRTGVHVSDIGPMRVAGRADLLSLGVQDRRFGWPLEMVLRAALAGWIVVEVPVPYLRRAGKSKVTGTMRGSFHAVRDMSKVLA